MKTFLSALSVISAALLFISCKDNGVGPKPEDKPGRRDYVWRVDTLDMPMNWLSSIWGASPNDVWAVGAGGTEYDRLWHYDGNKWSNWAQINNVPIWCSGSTIYGFGNNDVWMGGQAWLEPGAAIWHYNGNTWSKNFIYNTDSAHGINGLNIKDIWGSGPNDIYACGYLPYASNMWKGFILHFDGLTWREILQDSIRRNHNSEFLRIRKEGNQVYVFAYELNKNNDGNNKVLFYELNGNKLKEIYSEQENRIHWIGFNLIRGRLYYSINKDVFLYEDNNFIKKFSIDEIDFNYNVFGRNERDILLFLKGGLAHYNGTDIQSILNFPKTQQYMTDGLLFDKEVFIGLFDQITNKNLILHGKLKE